jgi:hypothetical protein
MVLAAVIACSMAFLMRHDISAQPQELDATLREDVRAEKELETSRPAAVADERVFVAPSEETPEEVALRYTLELHVMNTEGRGLDGAIVKLLEPTLGLDLVTTGGGLVTLALAGLEPHEVLVEGSEADDLQYIEQIIRWVPKLGEPVGQVEVVLQRAARIQGSLQCSDGSSSRSAGIDIFHVERESWSNAAAIEDGTFISQWMPPGEVIVYSRNGSWSGDDLKEREILTLVEGQTYTYHGTLAPAIDLIGTVVDTAGRPLENVPVDVYDERNPAYSESVITDADGRFLCDGLYPGTYLLDLPKSPSTPKARFIVVRGRDSVDMGHLVHR